MMKSTGILILSLVLTVFVQADTGESAAQEPAAAGNFAQLSWLAGYWKNESDGVVTEEFWLHPLGGMMLGLHRDSRQGSGAFFEYLRIEERPDGLVYLASPGGREATEFRAVKQTGLMVVFENPQHDYPQQISYQLDEAGKLHVRIAGLDDSQPSTEWVWERSEL